MLEIEKTYLIKALPGDLGKYSREEISQGYLSETVNEPPPLRIRQKGKKFELTKKFRSNKDLSMAEEINLPLSQEEFNRLWPLVVMSLEKTRYYFPLDSGLTAEVDVFHGDLEGLFWVEVEFKSPQQMRSFVPLPWFGPDITNESWSSNSFLAGSSYDEIKHLILAKESKTRDNP